MTPKQKAESLIEKFYWFDGMGIAENEGIKGIGLNEAKQCALICVDEIVLNGTQKLSDNYINYWHEVKQEIENL